MQISDLITPCLLLDRPRLQKNLAQMGQRAKRLGVTLRPHLKTAKSAPIANLATQGHPGGITVSTLREAEYFAAAGLQDITYAIGITPNKLARVAAIQAGTLRLNIITDHILVAKEIAAAASGLKSYFHVLLEIDTGYHRSGVPPDGEALLTIAELLDNAPGVTLAGILTHAGHSYKFRDPESIAAVAEEERMGAVQAASKLREAKLSCPVVSVGSTPTAVCAKDWSGVTEIRPGNYMFFDLDMAGRGVCTTDDIAVSVLTTIIGHQEVGNHILTDAGALALSKDLSADSGSMPGVGYGLVCDLEGQVIDDLKVSTVSQEQGWISTQSGRPVPFERFPVGSQLRILPNHSCLTAAAYERYYVLEGNPSIADVWPRIGGW